jgi:hypothetical protein
MSPANRGHRATIASAAGTLGLNVSMDHFTGRTSSM